MRTPSIPLDQAQSLMRRGSPIHVQVIAKEGRYVRIISAVCGNVYSQGKQRYGLGVKREAR